MPIDYSRIPTSDLEALQNGDLSKVSTGTLEYLSIYDREEKKITNPPTSKKLISTEEPIPEWAGKNPNLYGLYGAGRELYNVVGRPAIEAAGMIGGGIIGGGSGLLAGAGLGAIPGLAAGSGLGYAGARNLTGAIDRYLGFDRGVNVTPQKVLTSTGKDLLLGTVGAGPMPTSKTAKITQHIGKQATPEMLAKFGITQSPAELTGGKTLAQVESLLEQVPFSSDIVQTWRESEQLKPLLALRDKYLQAGLENTPKGQQLADQIQDVVSNKIKQYDASKIASANALRDYGVTRMGSGETIESLGGEGQKIASQRSREAVIKKNELFRQIGESVPDGQLEFKGYSEEAQKHLKELSALPNSDNELVNVLKWGTKVEQDPKTQKIIQDIYSYTDNPTLRANMLKQAGIDKVPTEFTKDWMTMQNHRNQLTDIIKGNTRPNNNPLLSGQMDDVQRRAKLLRDALDKDFQDIAEKSGGDVLDKWKIANAYYANEYSPVWKQKTIQDLAKKNPSEIINTAIKPGSTTEVILTKKALGEEGFEATIKPAFTNKILGAGRDEVFDPQRLMKSLNDYGDATLREIYSETELNTLKSIAKRGEFILSQKMPNESFLKQIAKAEPNIVIRSIVGSFDKMPDSKNVLNNISILKKHLNAEQTEGLKLEFLEKVFRLNQITDQIEPITLAKNIQKYQDTIKLVMTPKDVNGLNNLATILSGMSRAQQLAANPSGTAKNVIAWGVANQLLFSPVQPLIHGDVGEASGRVGGGLITAVLAPKALAKLYLNPTTRNLLYKGISTNRSSKEGIDLAKKLTIVLGNEYLSDTGE